MFSPQPESVQTDGGTFTSQLSHSAHPLQPHLALTVSVLQSGIVHIQAKEPQPVHPRWIVQDVVQPAAITAYNTAAAFTITATQTTARWTVAAGNDSTATVPCELTIAYKPLLITLSVNGQPTAIFNQRGLLNYEQSREKNPRPATPDAPADPPREDRDSRA